MSEMNHPLVAGTIIDDPETLRLVDEFDLSFMRTAAAHRDEVDLEVWMQAQIDHHVAGISACLEELHRQKASAQPTYKDSIDMVCTLLTMLAEEPSDQEEGQA